MSRVRFAPTPVALVVFALLHGGAAHAQAQPPLVLKPSPMLREDIPAATRNRLPTFLSGRSVHGTPDLDAVAEGDAQLRRGDTVINADRLEYSAPDDLAKAQGNVRINRGGNVFEGPALQLKVESFEGFFDHPRYRLLRNGAYGEAERVDFIDDKRSIVRKASYTTCRRKPGPDWMPDWILRADTIRIDEEDETGQAAGAVLSFMNVPVLPVPSVSFPLSDKRKSGLLPPTIGIDNLSGIEVTLPYYWNIAPNRDATIYPTLMTKRGLDLGGEFRYLESNYNGRLRGNFLPNDPLRQDEDRWGYSVQHGGVVATPAGGVGVALDLNRVSDDNYWRDFSRSGATLTQRLLANNGVLSWSRGAFSLSAAALKWQTLQDVSAPIVPPYDRLPQIVARYTRTGLAGGLEANVAADHSRFHSDPVLNNQPNGQRSYLQAQVSRPWQAPGWFVIPKLQFHATQYEFDSPLANGLGSATRSLPTFSLDSGLVLERDASYLGRNFRQTLEPRAFYVYTPFREQNFLPNYDSAQKDFNFATIYTENEFSGNDRIADNNKLTMGVSTRLLDPDTGAEAARFGVALRTRFEDQQVTLPGAVPLSERLSDILFGASVNWVAAWSTDAVVQYNPQNGRSIRSVIGGRYSPAPYRVVSAAYRLQRGQSEQLDMGWQWPLNDLWREPDENLGRGRGLGEGRWFSVGRLNWSLKDKRLVDSIVGLEYDAGCWLGRVVLERLQSGTSSSNKRILFQLEFVGFTRIGSNALQTLRENIPRYQFLREQIIQPSRFSNYD